MFLTFLTHLTPPLVFAVSLFVFPHRTDDKDAEEDIDDEDNDEDDVSHGAHSLSSDESSAVSSTSTAPLVGDDDFTLPPDLVTRATTRRGKVPRLIKQDLRRHYGTMILNALNMHDCELLQRWFHTFAVPSVELTRLQTFGPVIYADNHHTVPSLVTGRSAVASYLTEVQRRMPDIVSRMQPDTYRIIRWKDRPTSQVKYNITISGTMVQYPHLPHPDRTAMAAHAMSPEPQMIRFTFDVEITLHLNSEILLTRWEPRVVSSELIRIA
jgi:hypothetical protein